MKASEKLITMLELNNYNIDNLFLKKLVESEKSGNLDLHKYDNYSDLIICNHLFDEDKVYSTRNPLSYKVGIWPNIESIDLFVVQHPNVGKKLTIREFLSIEIFSETEKRDILNDVMNTWIDEYKQARSKSLEHLKEMFFIITKDNNNYYRKPKLVMFIIGLLFTLFNTILYINPEILMFSFLPSFNNFIDSWGKLLHDTPIYSVFGAFIILLFILYGYQKFLLIKRIRSLVREKTSPVIKKIYKWDIEMNKVISKQSKKLEKYVNLVVKKPERSRLELKKLITFEALLAKYRLYVKKVERKYYWMNKNYSKRMNYLRITYIVFILLNLTFIGLAFAIIRGLINV